jgi:hypothetical protein
MNAEALMMNRGALVSTPIGAHKSNLPNSHNYGVTTSPYNNTMMMPSLPSRTREAVDGGGLTSSIGSQ